MYMRREWGDLESEGDGCRDTEYTHTKTHTHKHYACMHTSMHPCLHAGVQTYTRCARTSQILAVVANIPMRPMKTEERLEIGFM